MKIVSLRALFVGVTATLLAACDCGGQLAGIAAEDAGAVGVRSPDAGPAAADAGAAGEDAGADGCAWSDRFGDRDLQSPTGLALAPDGTVVVTGSFFGSIAFGSQSWSAPSSSQRWTSNGALPGRAFVAKLDAAGGTVWSRSLSNGIALDGPMVAVDPAGAVHLAAEFRDVVDITGVTLTPRDGVDALLAMLGADGQPLWSRQLSSFIPGGAITLAGFGVDAAGSAVVLGRRAPGQDFFLAKIDATGALVWSHLFPNSGCDSWNSRLEPLAVNAAGEIFLDVTPFGAGSCSFDFGGGPLTLSPRGDNTLLARFDAAGRHLWSRRVDSLEAGAPGIHFAGGRPALGAAGEAYAFGSFGGTIDLGCGALTAASASGGTFVASFDGAGRCAWARQFSPFGTAITVLPAGNVLLSGTLEGEADFGTGSVGGPGRSIIGVELDPRGRTASAQVYGRGQAGLTALAVTGQGEVLLTGRLSGTARFCSRTLASEGSDDVFIAKLRR